MKKTRAVGRPRDLHKAEAIVQAAWDLFLDHGVEATSIEAIAARAGVSKVTVYSHYPDKAGLFQAAVRAEMERIEAAQSLGSSDLQALPIGDQLRLFGRGLLEFLTSKPAIDFYAVIAGELRRHAPLAADFYAFGPGRTRANLAAMIAAAARRGEVEVADAELAAEHLFGLWQGFSNFQLSLGIEVEAIRAGLPLRVEAGVAAFMQVYGRGARGG